MMSEDCGRDGCLVCFHRSVKPATVEDARTVFLPLDRGSDHYKKNAVEPIEYILIHRLNFCEGNVVKYITRWKERGGLDDLKKAAHYIDFLIADATNDPEKYGLSG